MSFLVHSLFNFFSQFPFPSSLVVVFCDCFVLGVLIFCFLCCWSRACNLLVVVRCLGPIVGATPGAKKPSFKEISDVIQIQPRGKAEAHCSPVHLLFGSNL